MEDGSAFRFADSRFAETALTVSITFGAVFDPEAIAFELAVELIFRVVAQIVSRENTKFPNITVSLSTTQLSRQTHSEALL
jgi:hypothetical protein